MVWLRVPSLRQGDALCLNAAINACKKASPGVSVAKAMLLDDRECLFTSIGDYHGLSSSMESLSMNQSNSRMIQNWTSLLVVKLLGYIPSISPLYHIISPFWHPLNYSQFPKHQRPICWFMFAIQGEATRTKVENWATETNKDGKYNQQWRWIR